MSTLAEFFHGADTHLGVFYPTHYILAIYPGFEEAEAARRKLLQSGLDGEEVIAVPGQDMMRLAAEHQIKDGLSGVLMRKLSRLFGTEALYSEHDLAMAAHG